MCWPCRENYMKAAMVGTFYQILVAPNMVTILRLMVITTDRQIQSSLFHILVIVVG